MIINFSHKDIVLSDLKLGPEGALNDGVSGAPEVQWTFYRDFAQASVHVTFSDFVDETWTLRVYKSDKDVVTESADGWVNVAWLYGAGVAETECGFDQSSYASVHHRRASVAESEPYLCGFASFLQKLIGE